MSLPKAVDFKTQIDESRKDKHRVERIWDLCLLYLRGKQHVTLDARSQTYADVRMPKGVTKATINRLLNGYRNLLAKLSMAYPGITVLPASPSPEDITKAEASEQAIKYFWHRDDVASTLEDVSAWLVTTGNAGIQVVYDPDDDEVHMKAISPFDLFYEGGIFKETESQWVAVRSFIHRTDLIEAYPKEKAFLTRLAQASVNPIQTEGRRAFGSARADVGEPKNRIEVFEVYSRRGGHAIYVEGKYLFKGKWKGKYMPIQLVRYTNVPGVLWGLGYIQPLIEIQDLYNRARSQVIDIIENHGWPKGKRAVGVDSGKAIEALSSNDMTQLQVTQRNIEKAVKISAETVLMMMRTYYREDKMMRMLDDTGRVVWNELQMTSIQKDPEVFLEAGTLFRDEKQDRDQKVLEMLQMQLIDPQTALRELDFKTGRSWVVKKMQQHGHARELLQGVLDGFPIEIFPSDDLSTIKEVFADFVRNEEYYELDEERQQYIRDVLIAVETFGQQDEETRKSLLQRTVFPPPVGDPADATRMVASMGSAQGAGQTSEQPLDHQLKRLDRSRLDEALPDRGDVLGPGGGG